MADFVGRRSELGLLRKRLDRVGESGSGVAVALRGRRQVGKSRLVQEFCDQAGRPHVFHTAVKGASPVEAVDAFCRDLRDSSLPVDRELVSQVSPGSWSDAFRALAAVLPTGPSIVVLDEVPWLTEQDQMFDGALQVAWDRLLRDRPVLLLLLGSDLHMMERLTAYDRPFFGRADNMVLGPLTPADTAQALGLADGDALDAHLVCGGLPGILRAWPHAMPALPFIERECEDPASPLFSIPESTLLAEFPGPDQARRVLESIGSGDRTQANIAASAGGRQGPLASGSLSPLLRRLVEEKRVVAADEPHSIRPGKPALYRIADSNLRLYLAALRQAQDQARRGRPQSAFAMVARRWSSWRGRAVEPLVREALGLAAAAGELPWPDVVEVGGWWNRQFDPEVDLVGVDRGPVAKRVLFAGSVKWLATPFDGRDLSALVNGAAAVPGFESGASGLAVVSLSGATADLDRDGVGLWWGAPDVLAAWRS